MREHGKRHWTQRTSPAVGVIVAVLAVWTVHLFVVAGIG